MSLPAAMGCAVKWGRPDLMAKNGPPIFGTAQDIARAQAAADADIDAIGPECAIPLATPLANPREVASIGRAG